ncbi:hypothetical protein K9U40_18865 [Xanthobacter autotrophicus]|uniref:hypothetical protein n=1 Tax=Xanthobacter TaxID=279 RepID=UPI0024AA6B80|nr:hypothetical protein [Xanthobacter autotrophicus]MDI4666369.1 hypothetical protein [Xanthobacter autotrophicus]
MVVTTPKQKEIFEKLLVLARGDIELVQDAIRICTTAPDKPADLEKVVGYVLRHRDRSHAQKVA